MRSLTDPLLPKLAVEELDRHGYLAGVSADEKERANAAVFAELHEWSKERLPIGSGSEVSEKFIRKGLKAVREKFRTDPTCCQKYGFVDPVTILTVVSALFSIISWLWWWLHSE